jgi:hypothetical protein
MKERDKRGERERERSKRSESEVSGSECTKSIKTTIAYHSLYNVVMATSLQSFLFFDDDDSYSCF